MTAKPWRPGPVAGPVLAALATADDGLTIAALTKTLGRPYEQRTTTDQAIRGLAARGFVRVLTRRRRAGKPEAVWGITTAGRAALERATQVCDA